jgi:general secretion pathway protein A
VVAAQLVSTQLDAEDTLRMVGAAFGVGTKNAGKSEVLLALEAFLVDVTRQGKRCLLIVDEAQNLTRVRLRNCACCRTSSSARRPCCRVF